MSPREQDGWAESAGYKVGGGLPGLPLQAGAAAADSRLGPRLHTGVGL